MLCLRFLQLVSSLSEWPASQTGSSTWHLYFIGVTLPSTKSVDGESGRKVSNAASQEFTKKVSLESLLLLSKFVQSCHSCCIIEEIITFFAPSISDARDKITRTISRLLCRDVYVLTTKILRSLVDLITHNLF